MWTLFSSYWKFSYALYKKSLTNCWMTFSREDIMRDDWISVRNLCCSSPWSFFIKYSIISLFQEIRYCFKAISDFCEVIMSNIDGENPISSMLSPIHNHQNHWNKFHYYLALCKRVFDWDSYLWLRKKWWAFSLFPKSSNQYNEQTIRHSYLWYLLWYCQHHYSAISYYEEAPQYYH